MRRTLTVVAIILTGLMSYGLYNMKYEVRRLTAELAGLEQKIAADRKGLQVLRAEWAYLNRPARLQKLAANHLDLQQIKATQVGFLKELPVRASNKLAKQSTIRVARLASTHIRAAQ
jgi:cell division protein FtsL